MFKKFRALFSQINLYCLRGKTMELTVKCCGRALTQNGKKLLALKNRYQGRRAFIIGNGPSLTKTDLRLLKNEITIGCNGLFLLFDYMNYLPTFYTVEDRLVAEDRADIINNIRGTIKIFPYDLRYCLKPDSDTIYINFIRQYPSFPEFSDKFESYVYWGGTVSFLNLQLAYYLGIREIYLIGIDHNYKGPNDRDEQEAFVVTSHSQDKNHFHPDYFGPGFRYHDPKVERMEVAYHKAKEFLNRNDCIVYNATIKGKLEVFPRIEYADVLSKLGIS